MTDSERQQILKMIEDGKISPEQGLVLMQALDEEPDDETALADPHDAEVLQAAAPAAGAEPQAERRADPDFERKLAGFRRLWVIPLWIGVAVTVVGAYWMFTALQSSGFGFLFFISWLPFLIGVLLVALAFSSRTSRWIYINVQQRPGASPQRIVMAFPLSLVTWILQFVQRGNASGEGAVADVMSAVLKGTRSDEPLLVDVDEDGEHVQVYIG